jgi:hypothetical protein
MNENTKISIAIGVTIVFMLILWWLTKAIGVLPLGLLALLIYIIWSKYQK